MMKLTNLIYLFTNIGPSLSENIVDNYTEYLSQTNINCFFLAPTTTPDEIASKLRSLPESKASDVPIKIIKASIEQLSTYLSNTYNLSFASGNYIDELKFATISPAHKGDSKFCLTNYRPISLLPIFSKILERLIHKRLLNFLVKNNLLFDHQFGFQPNKTKEMAILDIYSKIVNALEEKEIACCKSIQYSKSRHSNKKTGKFPDQRHTS